MLYRIMDTMNKGFITIAYGEYYQYLAYNLMLSYLWSVPMQNRLPFYVISDNSTKELEIFDKIIVVPPKEDGFMNKLMIDELSPFAETIFIDADCLIYNDISGFFDIFNDGGYSFSTFGKNLSFDEVKEKWGVYFEPSKAKKDYPSITYAPLFNAALYYCKKTGSVNNVLNLSRGIFYSQKDYGFPFCGDEPYVSLAMAILNCKCVDYNGSTYLRSDARIISSDIVKHTFRIKINEQITTSSMIHWSTIKTHHHYYKYEVLRLKYGLKLIKSKPLRINLMFYYLQWNLYCFSKKLKDYWNMKIRVRF